MRLLVATLCAVSLLVPSALHGQKYAGEFMALGGGARAMGMGSAFTAVANDVTATFWNPAGIADISLLMASPNEWQMSMMRSERFGDLIDYHFATIAFPLAGRDAGWGLTFIHMGIKDIPITPDLIIGDDGDGIYEPELDERLGFDYRTISYESANDFALFLSYAQVMRFGSVGASMKFIRNDQVTGVSSLGIGLDVGLLKRDLWRSLIFGVKLQDITGTYITWSTGEREFIYPAIKTGVAYPFTMSSMNSTLLIAVDGDFRFENRQDVAQYHAGKASLDLHIGAELIIRDVVSLRGGIDMGRPTAGAGFLLEEFGPWGLTMGLDYALLVHDVFDATHRVSLLVGH